MWEVREGSREEVLFLRLYLRNISVSKRLKRGKVLERWPLEHPALAGWGNQSDDGAGQTGQWAPERTRGRRQSLNLSCI